ncbi:MAG TPA: AGE family epimerase/isomerase, partial [Fimbriimonas sp.]|nr:AGE family epimerase/isomerase [Fimbriimonas sp.]
MQQHFDRHIAGCWLPRARRDSDWGFHQNYDVAWTPLPDTHHALVYHCRMLWLAAAAKNNEIVEHAVAELQSKFWDKDFGGYYWRLDMEGKPSSLAKHQYGNAFAIYALAKAGKLEEAMKAFEWVNKFAFDVEYGGFIDECSRNGRPRLEGGSDEIKTPYGYKSMNTSLHLLEAFLELYVLGKDDVVRERLARMLKLFMEHFTTPDGKLFYYLKRDFAVASDVDSYG